MCNLASINLSAFCERGSSEFDFQGLYETTKVVTRNLNRVIDNNYYPVIEARNSNMRHRPVGLGVQGLADALCMMRFPFESPEAKQLNKDIFETIYFGAVDSTQCQGKAANIAHASHQSYAPLTLESYKHTTSQRTGH